MPVRRPRRRRTPNRLRQKPTQSKHWLLDIRTTRLMKAIVYHEYGSPDVLKCEEIEKPVPKDDEVLIKVRAASVNPLDWRLMNGKPRALRIMPRLLKMPIGRPGVDWAGGVEGVGSKV